MIAYEEYQQKAVSQQTRNEILTPSRGTIYDSNMNALAISATVETVCISPNDIRDTDDPEATAKLVASGLSDLWAWIMTRSINARRKPAAIMNM